MIRGGAPGKRFHGPLGAARRWPMAPSPETSLAHWQIGRFDML